MKRVALALVLAGMLTAAHADGIGGGIGNDGIGAGIGNPDGVAATKINLTHPTGALLMTDNASFVLQTDLTSEICLAGATC